MVADLQLLKQPYVLNRDHGLISESPDEINLPLGKRLNKVTPY